jgi:arabinogalactan endo-1,4-beta-galactosidase
MACASWLISGPNAAALEKGADVSYVPQMEAAGYKWRNSSGTQEDILKICHDMGMNVIRLRTWVNPSNSPTSGHCDQAETIAMAKRIKAAGMDVYIDFHYGDTWNSVGVQNPPAAWVGQSYSQMKSTLYNYTENFCKALKAAGVTPKYASPGNEVNSGICHPTGSISDPTQMTGLINSGYDAIKAVFPSTLVIIHVAQIQKSAAQTMLDDYKAHGGHWDVTGFSCYATGSEVSGLVSDAKALQSRYGKPVFQVEFGEAESKASSSKNDLQAYFNGMKALGSNGVGVLYWEPEVYPAFNPNDTSGAWDQTSEKPTEALDPMKTN